MYEIIFYENESGKLNMKTWNEYKSYVKKTDPTSGRDISDIEEQAELISSIIKQRNELGLSQRDLASLCDIPQSSVARIESLQTTPNLATLLKIMKPLGLKLKVMK